MGSIIAKLLVGLGMKLLTESVMAKMIVLSLKAVSDKTPNKIDDKAVKIIADGLGVNLD